MTGRFLLAFTFLFSISTLNLSAQTEPLFEYGCHFTKSKLDLQPLTEAEKIELENSNSRSDTIDILNFSITLDITDYNGESITGSSEVLFTPKKDSVDHIVLDLQSLNIDSVYSDSVALAFLYDKPKIDIDLGQTLNVGDTMSLVVAYSGQPLADPSGFGGLIFDDNIVYNLGIGLGSNPYNYGRGWFPCFDNFIERATYDIDITSGGGRIPFAVGTLLEEEDLGGSRVRRKFRMAAPIPTYLVGFAASNYREVQLEHPGLEGSIPISLVAKASDTTAMKNSFGRLGPMIDALEYWFGPYAWERVGYVLTTVGAMEHNTLIAYPDFIAVAGLSFDNDRLMAHELAHHWWGNILTLSSPANMWIKEGNAEYGAHLFTEYLFGRGEFLEQVKDNLQFVLAQAHADNDNGDGEFLPLANIPFEHTYGTHTYQKGAAMMHNLRGYLGDEMFSSGMTAMLDFYRYQSIDAAQFRDFLSMETGVDLTDFFEAWIFNPGYSDFEIENLEITPNGDVFDVVLEVQQKLRAAPAYHNNVPLTITFYDENWNTHTASFTASGEFTTTNFPIPFDPVFQTINDDQNLNLGRLQNKRAYYGLGSGAIRNVGINTFEVTSITDSNLINVVHHWVGPDPVEDLNLDIRVSNSHYWTINGDFSGDFDAKITLRYDGRQTYELDYDLVNETEDSLIVIYRENPWDEWIEYPFYNKIALSTTDGFGFIRLNSVLPGDYAFANGSFPVSTHEPEVLTDFQVYPNPAEDLLHIQGELEHSKQLNMRLVDAMGRVLLQNEIAVENHFFKQELKVDAFPEGLYTIQLWDGQNGLIGAEKVLIR